MKLFLYIILLSSTFFQISLLSAKSNRTPEILKTSNKKLLQLHTNILNANTMSKEYKAIEVLHKEAVKENEPFFETLSYYYFVRYSRLNYNIEKTIFWLNKLDSISSLQNCNIYAYEGHKSLTELYCVHGDLGLAMLEAQKMNDARVLLDCPLSSIITQNTLAIVYISTGQYSEAKQTLQNILSQYSSKEKNIFLQTTLLLLIKTDLLLKDSNSVEYYLQQLQVSLESKLPDPFLINSIRKRDIQVRLHTYVIENCIQKGDYSSALKYVNEINHWRDSTTYIEYQIMYHDEHAKYNIATKQLGKALEELDKEIVLLNCISDFSLSILGQKAQILKQTGLYNEAFNSYLQLTQQQDSIAGERYIHQINRFKAEQEAKQKQSRNNQLKEKSLSLYKLAFCLFAFCIFLVILILINKNLKRKLQSAKDHSEHLDQLKSAFLANMNHEIRNPLNAIAGFSKLLAEEEDPETCKQYINIIKNNNGLLVNLLNDVLDISQIESDTITFSYSDVHIPTLMNELYQSTKLQIGADVKLIKEEGVDLFLYTDKNRLIQILSNLLSNAIKHTKKGQITFGYALYKPDKIRFYVKDTGEGIPENLQKEIFERFIQAVETHTKGVGLGLALCKGFIEHLGGEIGVDSTVGKGATFWFTLPYNKSE